MRTVKEMHIYVRSNVQLLSSNRSRALQKDEIDWELNKAQTDYIKRYIKQRPDGSFEVDTLHSSAIQKLVNNRTQIDPIRLSMESSFPLPGDCLHPLSAVCYNNKTCPYPTGETVPVPTPKKIQIWGVDYPRSVLTTGPFYEEVKLFDGVTELYTFPYTDGFPSKDDGFVPLNELLTYSYLRWERFLDVNQNNKLLLIVGDSYYTGTATGLKLRIDGDDTNFTLLKEYTWSEPVLNPTQGLEPFRIIPHDNGESVLTTPYYNNSVSNPGGYWNNEAIHSEKDSSFTVLSLFLNYVRKPRTISLTLGQHCELHTDYHKEICDLAVENIMSQTLSPAYEAKVGQDRLRGNLAT
jgi:hypothetical protein